MVMMAPSGVLSRRRRRQFSLPEPEVALWGWASIYDGPAVQKGGFGVLAEVATKRLDRLQRLSP